VNAGREHLGPGHDQGCLHRHMNDAVCAPSCSHHQWLDEPVPRAQARAELLTQLERWAREQRTFEVGDVERIQAGARGVWAPSERSFDVLSMAVAAASKLTQTVYERVAVTALNMRDECDKVLGRRAAAEKATAAPDPDETPARLPPPRADEAPASGVVTVAVQESLL
jgi:hypothetical protein